MSDRGNLPLFLVVFGSFIAAALLGLFAAESRYAISALLVGGGLASFVFARSLATTQLHLSEKPLIPSHWSKARPFTFKLWGAGLIVLGILHLSGV